MNGHRGHRPAPLKLVTLLYFTLLRVSYYKLAPNKSNTAQRLRIFICNLFYLLNALTYVVDSPTKRDMQEEQWKTVIDDLIGVKLAIEAPISFQCSVCAIDVDQPIRCVDCKTSVVYCQECEKTLHRDKLHKPEIWKG